MKAQAALSLFISCLMLAACSGSQTLSPVGGPSSGPASLGGQGTGRLRILTLPQPRGMVPTHRKATPHTHTLSGQIVEFDPPGVETVPSPICYPYCGTQALSNNSSGVTVGAYTDANIVPHGFIRDSGGAITSFDAPGAGLGANLDQGTYPYSISDSGLIAGEYQDSSFVYHSFVRASDGSFDEFDAPGAGTAAYQGTLAVSVNNRGDTAGIYVDSTGQQHGFVRPRGGTAASFDPPGSVLTMVCEETCVNETGVVTGYYFDASFVAHGFVRASNGQITAPIDAPGAGPGTILSSINANGATDGLVVTSADVDYGVLRSPGGAISTFNVPGATGTGAFSINASGAATGQWYDSAGVYQGYERFSNGTYAMFNAPGAAGTGPLSGTRPSTNNASGVVTGWWADQTGLIHGFVWTPGGSQSRHKK